MSGFCYVSRHDHSPERMATVLSVTRQQFARSGFAPPVTYDDAAGVLDFYAKINYPSSDSITLSDGFAVAGGTFLYNGAVGAEALRRFVQMEDHNAALRDAQGHFALVLRRDKQTTLLRDRVGAFEVFRNDTMGVISTSFLAVARTLRRVQINLQEIYEYVFNGSSLGNSTPVKSIWRLGFGERILLKSVPVIERTERPLVPLSDGGDGATQVVLRTLLDHTAMLGQVFGGRIKLALSGGYDTRLVLALFRHNGFSPDLFVYGNADSSDVQIARRITTAEGLRLRQIDLSILMPAVSPEQMQEVVADNFHREDGLPSDGVFPSVPSNGVLSPGGELIQRADRHAAGHLHVSGGGGEVFRNFFNLFDRDISLHQFVRLFYSQYDPANCRDFDQPAYEDAICIKIADLLGIKDQRLNRRAVETLYPYFRCRSWFGRENSINNRFGYSVLPFYERQIADLALAVPIRQKYVGNLESRMIRAADPALASYPSNYGHSFADDAPLWVRLSAFAGYSKPLMLRRYTYRIKNYLHATVRPPILSPEFIRHAVAPDFPRMSRYFHIGSLSNQQFNRIATLEYLFNQLDAE